MPEEEKEIQKHLKKRHQKNKSSTNDGKKRALNADLKNQNPKNLSMVNVNSLGSPNGNSRI